MKVGVNLINFGPSAEPQTLRGWAELTETLGYHLLMTSDHIAVTPDVESRYPAPLYEPLTTLGWLAAITRRIQIGTTVIIAPYRSPLETARALANVDNLSGGRCIFGVGVGWAEQEFRALGLPFNRRGAMTDEYLHVIKKLWTEDVVSFAGEFVEFDGVRSAPRPVQDPHPPIWVGGSSDAALRRTVLLGDAWHPIRVRVPRLERVDLPRLRAVAAAEGRPMPALCPRIRLRLTEKDLPADDRVAGEGSLGQIHEDLRALEALGASHVLLDTYFDDVEATRRYRTSWRWLATLADEVLDLDAESVRA